MGKGLGFRCQHLQRCVDTFAAETPKLIKNVVFAPDLARETDSPLFRNVSCRRRAAALVSVLGFKIQDSGFRVDGRRLRVEG